MKSVKLLISRISIAFGVLGFVFLAHASDAAKQRIAHGEAIYNQGMGAKGVPPCLGCHGLKGESLAPLFPNLAGMPHEYLVKQLHNFRIPAGETRANRMGPQGAPTAMSPIVAGLSKQDIEDIALYLSTLTMSDAKKAKAKLSYDPQLLQLGRDIYRAGIPEKRVPACASCHGAKGEGIAGQFPRLSGQHPEYLQQQMEGFLHGYRTNATMMQNIVDRMSPEEIRAVVDYAAGLR